MLEPSNQQNQQNQQQIVKIEKLEEKAVQAWRVKDFLLQGKVQLAFITITTILLCIILLSETFSEDVSIFLERCVLLSLLPQIFLSYLDYRANIAISKVNSERKIIEERVRIRIGTRT